MRPFNPTQRYEHGLQEEVKAGRKAQEANQGQDPSSLSEIGLASQPISLPLGVCSDG